jgi:hypothetical protein
MRLWGATLLVALALYGCGSGETVGTAAEAWCRDHYPKSSTTESRCFDVIFEQRSPKRFLEALERGEQINAEVALLRAMHP